MCPNMRIHVGLPKMFWADTVNIVAYMIDRGPWTICSIGWMIPEEAQSRKETSLSHLKVFGCVLFVHIDTHARSKLDPKFNSALLLGMTMVSLVIDYKMMKIEKSLKA